VAVAAARTTATPTGRERTFDPDEVIVSKTDPRGRITYANRVFCRVSGYSESELVGAPHSLIRHPAMPRVVFKLIWDTIASGKEIFGYVVNLARNGDHYWVFAHVTPTFDGKGKIVAYHSNRRVPTRRGVDTMTRIYAALLAEEKRYPRGPEQMAASGALLTKTLADAGVTYEQFVFSLGGAER
jgi:PAS domain S-box-containing protein